MKNHNHNINREAAKIFAISSGKVDPYKYLTGEEILPSDKNRMIEQPRFGYYPLEKTLGKKKQLKIKEENKLKL